VETEEGGKRAFNVNFIEASTDEIPATFSGSLSLIFNVKTHKIVIAYDSQLFKKAFIKQCVSSMNMLVESIMNDPNQQVGQSSVLTTKELHKQLVTWNDTSQEFPHDMTLVQLFEKQTEKSPNSIAIKFDSEMLTYRELNERVNRLARIIRKYYLAKEGIKADTLIGIYIERGISMIVAMLGILKAGGAYVPLDPNYPENRIRFMVLSKLSPRKNYHTISCVLQV